MNLEGLIGKTITDVATDLNADGGPNAVKLSFADGTTVEFKAFAWADGSDAEIVIDET